MEHQHSFRLYKKYVLTVKGTQQAIDGSNMVLQCLVCLIQRRDGCIFCYVVVTTATFPCK